MEGYTDALHHREGHKAPAKPQPSPHKHREIFYCDKCQYAPEEDRSPPLENVGIKRVQCIMGALSYYARTVDNRLLAPLSAIRAQQAAVAEETEAAADQLFNYVATYPADGTVYRVRGMRLAAQSDKGLNNKSRGRSRNGSHVFLSEEDAQPH